MNPLRANINNIFNEKELYFKNKKIKKSGIVLCF